MTLSKLNDVAYASLGKLDGILPSNISNLNGITLTPPSVGFITKWTVAGDATARTITLPLIETRAEGALAYDCVIDWGDGTATSAVTTFDDADRAHTYASDGTYNVNITGTMEGWSFNNTGDKLKIVEVVNWGEVANFNGFKYLKSGFYGCTNLTSLGTGKILASGTGILTQGFENTFQTCSSLTAIPSGLFDNNTAVSTSSFRATFLNCDTLTAIPSGLFDYNINVSSLGFLQTFYSCGGLTTIPAGLFDNNTAVSSTGFNQTFNGCTSLTAIPSGLFDNNTAVSDSGFYGTFYGCTSLVTIPDGLFKFNINVSTGGFDNTFYGCNKLQFNPWTFYLTGEEGTRFLNRTAASFTSCFYRVAFTGTQGTAPALWDCTFGTTTLTSTNCYAGNGNSETSLTNYASIPAAWGGPA